MLPLTDVCGIDSLVLAALEPMFGCSARLQAAASRLVAVANVSFGSFSPWKLGGKEAVARLPLNVGMSWCPGSVARSVVSDQPVPISAMKAPSRGGRAVEPPIDCTWSSKIRSTESSGSRRSSGLLSSSTGTRLASVTAT